MIHASAIIDKSATIEDNVEIGAYSCIGPNVIIKSGTVIGTNVYIEHCEIGSNCKIFHGASVGTPPQDLGYKNEPSKAYIGDGTTLREFVTINRGSAKTGKTIIGKNCYFMTASHAAHDTRIGDNVIMANNTSAAGHVEIGDNAFVSGNVGIHQFCRIGKGSMTGVGTSVTMDIIPYALCAGYRAQLNGLNLVGMKRRKMTADEINDVKDAYKTLFASKLLLNDALAKLSQSGSVYVKEIVEFIKTSKRGIARPE
ncbi:acyl-ACP--UDP-N-acetylglucosamine O-acyltransferase [Endomicrobium proavitum]|nr:acyl-ACP--UDP-N-acetylglucosamine O-acyltransferase [Endomicrobium proavitum]